MALYCITFCNTWGVVGGRLGGAAGLLRRGAGSVLSRGVNKNLPHFCLIHMGVTWGLLAGNLAARPAFFTAALPASET